MNKRDLKLVSIVNTEKSNDDDEDWRRAGMEIGLRSRFTEIKPIDKGWSED
jgi:hypothetical protein